MSRLVVVVPLVEGTRKRAEVDQARPRLEGEMVDVLRSAVERAVRAPSSHNTQPWSFRIDGEAVRLYADASRRLPHVDPDGRELVISCGAALFTLEVAIAHLGYEPRVDALPDPSEPDLIAVVTLGPARRPSVLAEKLFEAIPHRRTNRRTFYERAVPETVISAIAAAAASEGARLVRIAADDERAEVADLLARADVVQFHDKGFRRELATWFRPNGSQHRDGMPGYSLGFGDLSSRLAGLVLRRFDLGRSRASRSRELVASSPLLGAIVTDGDGPRDWVRAGRALQRALLLATAEGVSVSFLNQAVEVPELRDDLRTLIGAEGIPQLLLRFGYAPQARPVPRRPLAEVLVA
jgi:hypothetical protein